MSDTPFPPRGNSSNPHQSMNQQHLAHNSHHLASAGTAGGGFEMSGGAGGNIPITLEEFLKVGSVVRATTLHGVVHQGEIMAVDNKTRLVFIAVPVKSAESPHNNGNMSNNLGCGASPSSAKHNIVMMNLNMLKNLDTVSSSSSTNSKEATSTDTPVATVANVPSSYVNGAAAANSSTAQLSSCRVEDAEARFRSSLCEKLRKVENIGVGVSPEAQLLFDKLSKQYKQCSWSGATIRVGDANVTVRPPYYSPDNTCACVRGEKESSVSHVKALVDQIWRSQILKQQQNNNNSIKKSTTNNNNTPGLNNGNSSNTNNNR